MIRKLNLNSLFLTMAILLLAVSCDKEELSESVDFHEHTENNKSIYETIDVDNLPDLREELNTIS